MTALQEQAVALIRQMSDDQVYYLVHMLKAWAQILSLLQPLFLNPCRHIKPSKNIGKPVRKS